MKKLITDIELRRLAGESKQLLIPADAILTPSAQDWAGTSRIELVREGDSQPPCGKGSPESASMDEIRHIVQKVVAQQLRPACANPRLTHVRGSDVKLEPFDQAPPGQKVELKDVVTSREGNLAAGFMTFDRSELPWHLTYDEVDYIVEGTFTLKANGRTYTCLAGDVLYIPKDTRVVFGSPDRTRVFYVTYPANWAEK
jgi:ethanolamine utilization protein EutQ